LGVAPTDSPRRPSRTSLRALGALFLAPGKPANAFEARAVSVPPQSFQYWQGLYAEHRIATFPVRVSGEGKVPAIKGWQQIGLPGSSKLAQRFAGAPAFGFCPGKRSNITILDVDTPNERVLADALDRYGPTPVIVRSGSGHFQAWYRYNGEGRSIRPEPDIDVLGSGFVVAPPSRGMKGDYRFIQGHLDDLAGLATMQNIKITSPPLAPTSTSIEAVTEGRRNKTLWEHCMRSAHFCDDFESLIDVARTSNAEYLPPLPDNEVVKTAKSAWGYTERGDNRFGQTGVWFSTGEVNSFITTDQDAFLLLSYLKSNNGPNRTFIVANGLADTLGWTRKRFAGARNRLEGSHLEMVRPPSKCNGPALYRWRTRKSDGLPGG
jgi:hypothetical protein